VAGRQGDCYILPILEGLASVARDYKRDIYSRFLYLARDILPLFLHITITPNYLYIYTYYLIIVYLSLVLSIAFAL
jgi:hypothetical protein